MSVKTKYDAALAAVEAYAAVAASAKAKGAGNALDLATLALCERNAEAALAVLTDSRVAKRLEAAGL